MSLRRKILFKDVVLLVSLSLMIAAALRGLLKQREHVHASLSEYAALSRVQVAQTRLVAFQQALHAGQTQTPQARADLHAAVSQMREYKTLVTQYDNALPPEITPDLQSDVKAKTKHLVTGLMQLAAQVDPPKKKGIDATLDPVAMSAPIDQFSREMADLLAVCNGFVHRTELESAADIRSAIVTVSTIAGCTWVAAVVASFWQYQRIMRPLLRLRQWCRLTADGDFSIAYKPTSDREFQELGRDVNRMAAELEAFTRKMELMVASKSRELVRSERLASVGYLAAGVAHEINNPLNIMSGYAELTIKRLRRLAISESDAEVIQHLSIIRSEAFRCKEITQKLLSLAKGSGDAREAMSITDAILEVVALVRGLKSIRNRSLEVVVPDQHPLVVQANLTEIKQVLLNLIINAIEAVGDNVGKIRIEACQTGDQIEMNISDNGRGMTPEIAERVFEPFFTHKRGSGDPGTGLGLSITHAIITDHRGRIFACSEGTGRGSRFTISLPAAQSQMFMRNTSVPDPPFSALAQ